VVTAVVVAAVVAGTVGVVTTAVVVTLAAGVGVVAGVVAGVVMVAFGAGVVVGNGKEHPAVNSDSHFCVTALNSSFSTVHTLVVLSVEPTLAQV
jgi:hypothetical protein